MLNLILGQFPKPFLRGTLLVTSVLALGACSHQNGSTPLQRDTTTNPVPAPATPNNAPTNPTNPPVSPAPGTTAPGTTSPGTTSPGTTSPGTTPPDANGPTDPNSPVNPSNPGQNNGQNNGQNGSTDPNAPGTQGPNTPGGDDGTPTDSTTLVATVHFEFDRSILRSGDRSILDGLLNKLGTFSSAKITWVHIVGHADRLGAEGHNKTLSKQRAVVVRNYLLARSRDLLPTPLPAVLMQIDAQGAAQPKTRCPADTPLEQQIECLQPDRYAEVTIEVGTTPALQTPQR